jgi:hypothetical protein
MLAVQNGEWARLHPYGGGPFAVDDAMAAQRSWGLCALLEGIVLTDWLPLRERLWRASSPWTEGLTTLFGCVQDELLSQWRALPRDGKAHEVKWKSRPSALEGVVVPEQQNDPMRSGADSLSGAKQSRSCEPSVTEVANGVGELRLLVNGLGTPADGAKFEDKRHPLRSGKAHPNPAQRATLKTPRWAPSGADWGYNVWQLG